MALFDENGNPIEESNNFPTIPEQPPRQVDLSIKDKEEENYVKVDADGNINVVCYFYISTNCYVSNWCWKITYFK